MVDKRFGRLRQRSAKYGTRATLGTPRNF